MRISVFHTVRTGLLSLGLALGATGMASAQTDADRNATGSTGTSSGGAVHNTPVRASTAEHRDDRGFDLGWLGLLGLAGLIPLFTHRNHDNRGQTYNQTNANTPVRRTGV
jgi:hypothetical protein